MLDLLLADGRTPTGGFAHSGGLEAMGLEAAMVPGYIAARLQTVALLDASVAARVAGGDDPLALDAAWLARTPAPAVRDAGRRLGRGLLRLGCRLWPAALNTYAATSAATPRPVVLGLCGREAGLTPRQVARLALYDDAASVAAAAPKLLAVDGLETTVWLHRLEGLVERLTEDAARVGPLPSPATPRLDVLAELHNHERGRLFAS